MRVHVKKKAPTVPSCEDPTFVSNRLVMLGILEDVPRPFVPHQNKAVDLTLDSTSAEATGRASDHM